ncbi:MAG: methyl-accepting chemotaxis protein, partial [Pseudomonadota bacterium]
QAAAAAESMQEQAQELTQAISTFKLSGGNSHAPTPVKRSNRPVAVAKLPSRGPATKKAAASSNANAAPASEQPRKVAAGGGDDNWEEF